MASLDPAEIAKFAALADRWWRRGGAFEPLHRLNPTRLGFVRDRVGDHFGRSAADLKPFAGLTLLDIGCGGGLVAEPMARLGAAVTAIDGGAETVAAARVHAEAAGLAIDYRQATAEDLVAEGRRFDIVLALEVVEHVPDVPAFLGACAELAAPGGCLVLATLNRTGPAFALGIVMAEHVLRWVPRGTHEWRRFVRPSELRAGLAPHGIRIEELAGMTYRPLGGWGLSRDLSVNYLAFATKRTAS